MTADGSVDQGSSMAEGPRIDGEHASLRALLARMRAVHSSDHLAPLLDEARQFLRAHFAREEEVDGLFAFVLDECPRHVMLVQRLRDEHGALLGELGRLLQLAHAPLNATWSWSLELSAFVRAIEQHESIESDLLHDALQDELGVGD